VGAGRFDASAAEATPSSLSRSPVDLGRPGSKHHLICDAGGTPLAVNLTGGNRNDVTQLIPLVDAFRRSAAGPAEEPVAGPARPRRGARSRTPGPLGQADPRGARHQPPKELAGRAGSVEGGGEHVQLIYDHA